jgi:ankyrin repeat protein
MNRKTFFFNTGIATAGLLSGPMNSLANFDAPEPYSPLVVKEFVGAGHNNLSKVKELLSEYPNLLYSRYDWGNGDFEEAIEGAGHVGNKEIANFLIEQGARPNIYVLTMLGETAIVKSMLEKYPSLLRAKGPHGYTLLHHAVRGGDASAELCDYLEKKGLKELRIMIK